MGTISLNFLIYLAFYIRMKYKYGERVIPIIWFLCLLVLCLIGASFYFFEGISVTDKFLTPEESQALNKPCILFDYFDAHDIWHFLSAFALLTMYLIVFLLDWDLKKVPRKEIAVF